MEIPTQFSYETISDKNLNYSPQPELLFEINDLNNLKKKKVENIFDEVEEIKKKKSEKEINYIDSLNISEQEYERSLQDLNKITEILTEDHIVEMISIRKLFFVYKHILEIFAFLIGEGYFEWTHFRAKLNIHEIKYRMTNCNLNIFSRNKINDYLNKIYKNKKLTDEYLKNDLSGIGIIFKWIKAALKVCLYKLQIKKSYTFLNSKEERDEYNNYLINNQTKDKITKFSKLGVTKIQGSSTITSNCFINNNLADLIVTNYKETTEAEEKIPIKSKLGGGFYLTAVNQKNSLPLINSQTNNIQVSIKSDNSIKEEEYEDKSIQQIPKKNIPIIKRACHQKSLNFFDQNSYENSTNVKYKQQVEKYNISSLPLVKFKTYNQLKRYFKSISPTKSTRNGTNIQEDIDKLSLRNPKNYEKIVNILSLGQIKRIDDETFNAFLDNMKMEDYFKNN